MFNVVLLKSTTIHWAELRDANCRRFMTSSFPPSLLTLDCVTSFLRIENVRNTCRRLRFSQIFGWNSSVQWRKDTTAFSSFLVC